MALRILVSLVALMLLPVPDALACSCAEGEPAYMSEQSDAVITAKVVALRLIESPIPVIRVELQVLERFKGDIEEGVIFLAGPTPPRRSAPASVLQRDPRTSEVVLPGAVLSGTSCDSSNLGVFALSSEYVVSAFRNRPGSPLFLDLPEAQWVTAYCTATYETNSDMGRRYLAGLREIVKKTNR